MIPHAKDYKNDIDEKEYVYDVDHNIKKIKWWDWLLLNRPLKVITIFLLAAIAAPPLIYHFLFSSSFFGSSYGSCLINRDSRLPCGLGNVTAAQCSRECCYDHANGFCFYRFPSRFTYILNDIWNEDVFLSPRIPIVPYGFQGQQSKSLDMIRISVDEVSATHLSLTFYKSDEKITGRRIKDKNYMYNIIGEHLNVIVNSTQGNIFNTANGPFIAANDIWEITFRITNETMFGLGEIPLLPDTVKVIYNHKEGLSSIPLIFAKLNGSYHGLLIDTVSPTEVNIRRGNQLIVRSITNFGLKFHLFVGPKPSDIMRDVMNLIGKKTNFEYWMLGPHFCSEDITLNELRTFITDTTEMPFESHCGVAPPHFSSECNSTYVNLVNDGARVLRDARRKFVPHVSPYIRYTIPEIADIEVTTEKEQVELQYSAERCFDDEKFEQYIIRDPNATNVYMGLVDEHDVIYPKYDNVSEEFMKNLWVYSDVDGVVLKNNWPLDESEKFVNATHLFLPYFNKNFEIAFQHTPQWNATRPERYLYTHNEYGNTFATAFNMIKQAIPIMSTSQWMNGNMAISRQGIQTSWASLQRELIEASLGGISGHWYWSSPVCGDTENFNNITHNRLCAKWYMASTYFPMIQIYSKGIRRDPLAFTGTDRAHMIRALRTRTSIMPYLYSVLQEGPLLRPMFYQFPSTEELTNLTSQFSVGDDLLILPNLHPGQTHVHVWMPPGQWFEFGGGLKVEANVGEAVAITTTEADFLTLIRGGSIIVRQMDIRSTTADTQNTRYTVLVTLHCETINVTEEIETTTQAFTETDAITEEIKTSTQVENVTDAQTDEIETTTQAYIETDAVTENANITTVVTTCSAKGKFNMSPNMTILFEANQSALNITAEGDDFNIFCGNQRIWNEEISHLRVYGLDKDKNNNDHHFMQNVAIRLCDLINVDQIVHQYTSM